MDFVSLAKVKIKFFSMAWKTIKIRWFRTESQSSVNKTGFDLIIFYFNIRGKQAVHITPRQKILVFLTTPLKLY